MTSLRENLGWITGSVITAIATAISWLVSSQIFIALVSVLVDFLCAHAARIFGFLEQIMPFILFSEVVEDFGIYFYLQGFSVFHWTFFFVFSTSLYELFKHSRGQLLEVFR